MNIAVIGTGNIGGTLGRRWAERGHTVVFGTRDPKRPAIRELLAAAGPHARAAGVAEAVTAAEVVLIAVPAPAVRELIAQAGDWHGKILIDAANRFNPPSPSLSEEIAGWAAGARVVKAFNSIGAEVQADPAFGAQQADAFLCGDDADAKSVVAGLAGDIGLEPVDAGPLANAPLLDNLTRLWMALARSLGRGIAFKLLRR